MRTKTLLATLGAGIALSVLLSPARAALIASDNFTSPPYSLAPLNGQTVGGTGFTGSWGHLTGLTQNLSVLSGGLVGRPTSDTTNAGDFANFISLIAPTGGQLFISYNIGNGGTPLSSTRLDLNAAAVPAAGQRAFLGQIGNATTNFNLQVESGLGAANVDSGVSATGNHNLIGVLDFQNHKIAIFVDPTNSSFYNPGGTNNATAVSAWTPAAGISFSSYSLVENTGDHATFGAVKFATDFGSVAVPEPSCLFAISVGSLALLRRRRRV